MPSYVLSMVRDVANVASMTEAGACYLEARRTIREYDPKFKISDGGSTFSFQVEMTQDAAMMVKLILTDLYNIRKV